MMSSMSRDEHYLGLAKAVLGRYGIEHASLKRLGGEDNINFRVDDQGKTYVLRLRLSQRHTEATVLSEIAWLKQLQKDSELNVPSPISNLENDFVTLVDIEDKTIPCTLMTWLEGKVPPTIDAMTDEQIEKLGLLMAELHRHSKTYKLPGHFAREAFDKLYFGKRLEALYNVLQQSDLDRTTLSKFKVHADGVLGRFAELEPTTETYGLIHADFHSGNYLVHKDDIHIIDFDRCGFGFYFFDIALALMELEKPKRTHFVRGYERVQSLPENFEQLHHLFLCLAYIDNLGFHAPKAEELPNILAELPFVTEVLQTAMQDMP